MIQQPHSWDNWKRKKFCFEKLHVPQCSWQHYLQQPRYGSNPVQLGSVTHVQLFATPWIAAHQASLSITNSWRLLKLMSIEQVMSSNQLIHCHPLLFPPSIFPSIRVFFNESALPSRWPKYWSFSFNICPSNEYSGLISFRMDWWDLLAAQGTLKSLLQHHSSKASILRHSAFFIAQLSHQYKTTGKTIALTRQTFTLVQADFNLFVSHIINMVLSILFFRSTFANTW